MQIDFQPLHGLSKCAGRSLAVDATGAGFAMDDMRFHFCNVVCDIVQCGRLTINTHFEFEYCSQAFGQHHFRFAKAKLAAAFIESR